MGESGGLGDEEDALGLIVGLADFPASGALLGQLLLGLGELVVGIPKKDETKNRDGILRRLEFRVRPEVVGGFPETLFEFGMIICHR